MLETEPLSFSIMEERSVGVKLEVQYSIATKVVKTAPSPDTLYTDTLVPLTR